jgi:hypothetical protein
MIFSLFRDYKPLTFFGGIGLVLIILGLIPGARATYDFLETGIVTRVPSAILSVGLELAGMLSFTIGLVLHTITRRARETEYLMQALFDEVEKLKRSNDKT